jgi:hypothetical protein
MAAVVVAPRFAGLNEVQANPSGCAIGHCGAG